MATPRMPKMPRNLKRKQQEAVRFVNCTPHPVSMLNEDGSIVTIPVSGTVARHHIDADPSTWKVVGGFLLHPIQRTGKVVGLPAPVPNTYYIVSYFAKDNARSRTDLVCVGGRVHDSQGNVLYGTHFVF